MSRHNAKPPPKNQSPVERTFAAIDRLFVRIYEQNWNHRALGRLNDRGAYHDPEATSESETETEE